MFQDHCGNLKRRYDLLLSIIGNVWWVSFDCWLFLQSKKVLINRAKVSKYGFTSGEATLFSQ